MAPPGPPAVVRLNPQAPPDSRTADVAPPGPPAVVRLVLERFRSIPSACITFDNPTIFVGRNGSGKSNLISAFSFLSDAMRAPLRTVFDRAGGFSAVRNRSPGGGSPPRFGMRVDLAERSGGTERTFYAFAVRSRPNHGFSVSREQCVVVNGESRFWFDRRGTRFRSNVEGLTAPPIDDESLILPVIGGVQAFWLVWRVLSGLRVYAVDPQALRKTQEPGPGVVLRRDAGNAASVLREIEKRSPETFALIAEVLATITPNLDSVAASTQGRNLTLGFRQRWGAEKPKRIDFEAFEASDGTLRVLGILTALFQRAAPALIAVEEPETNIHPGALESVLDVLLAASERIQVVMTTHSPELLDAKWITDRHLRMVDWREGATHVAPVSAANRTALRNHLMGAGELLRANALESAMPADNPDARRRLFESV